MSKVGAEVEMFKLNNSTLQKIEEKTELLQFLPSQLEELSKIKSFEYNGIRLKSSYIIDLIHNLIFKYHINKENLYYLYSPILQKKYGRTYNTYIKYLIDKSFLSLVGKYSTGKHSNHYALNVKLLNQKIKRFSNVDRVLLKKYKESAISNYENESSLIDSDIKTKLINDLFTVTIEQDKVIYFLDHLEDNDISIYNKNKYSSESIENGDIFYHFDKYGRMHTNFTTLKTFIRKNCILIDGESPVEFDIKNSQPLFLTKLIIDSNSQWVNKEELSLFKDLTMNGNYYKFLINKLNLKNKKEAKKLTYEVFFGKTNLKYKYNKGFKSLFPTIYNFIKLYKEEHGDYRSLSHELQRQESNFIFNKLIRSIMTVYPEIKIITVHDSIVVKSRYRELIQPIFESKLKEEFNF